MAGTDVAALSEVPEDRGHQVVVDGVPICLVRDGDSVKALHDVCSHQDFSLAEGYVYDGAIECALHGSMFDLDTGVARSMPATVPAPTFHVDIKDGRVFVDAADQTNDAPVPNHG